MTEASTGQQVIDSDTEFERPKDEFMFYYKASKLEEKKLMQHSNFDEIVAKFWQLIRSNELCDLNKATISENLYTELMKRIYRLLLPLYRANEMNSEISQEWIMDCKDSNAMSYKQFTKTLFRIANEWSTNFDLEEYVDFLQKIYDRITLKKVTKENGSIQIVSPTIQVEFPQEEVKVRESGGKIDLDEKQEEWLECGSNESENSDFEYEYKEDNETMVTKKFKKAKDKIAQEEDQKNSQIKDPIQFTEQVLYFQFDYDYKPKESDIIEEILADMKDVIPLGYPSEQFFKENKNEVHENIQAWIQQNKRDQNKQKMYLSNFNQQEIEIPKEADTELKQAKGEIIYDSFNVKKTYASNVQFVAKLTDSLYNYLRYILRDGCIINLRMYSDFPKPGARTKSRHIMSEDPITELNRFGYNPALERRIHYKLIHGSYVNINYLLYHPEYEIAYRSDVAKVETKDNLAIKEPESTKKDEEFNNVETSFKQVKKIMLAKKFYSIYQDRQNYDIREQKRLWKMIRKDEKRKEERQLDGTLQQKGLQETYDDRSFIKMTRGPYYQLESKDGIKEDNFVNSAEWDLIEAARQKALRILILGKPRSGKTTLCKSLAKKLDLVHICVENWITQLQEKIKNYEPPEDLEEGEEPPKFLNVLEESVDKQLKEGDGPTDQQIVQILQEQILSAQSKTKGYVLDITFYKRDMAWAHTIRQQKLLGELQDGSSESFSHIIELQCSDEEVQYRAQHMRVSPEDGEVFSRWDREERKRQQPKEDEEEQEPEEGDEPKPVLNELNLIQRSNDTEDQIKDELEHYNNVERTAMEELLIYLYDNQYIKVDSADLTPEELTQMVSCRIHPDENLPLRPIGEVIEGGNDFKSLLSEGLEEGQVPRKWSLWQQIDPVLLHKGKVVQGTAEYAASYNNNVFVFISEENMNEFIKEPKVYLQDGAPYLPESYRVLMLGAKGSGKYTQALSLSELYGWKIVDFNKVVSEKLSELLSQEEHTPNNPEGGKIGMSEQELQEIQDAKPFPAWKFVPWILDYLGYQLMKKPPPPPPAEEEKEEEEEELDEAQQKKKEQEAKKKKEEEDKKKKEEEAIKKQKDDRKKKRQEAIDQGLDLAELGLEESDEEPVIIDDLSIEQLVLKQNENEQVPFVGGFILIGFPETEEHINKLKEHHIEFDKIIYLQDTNEEDPGTEIKQRVQDDMYDYEWEVENQQRILGLVREHFEGEEIVKEISCNGANEEVLIRIRNEIDPFYLKIDNPDDNRVTADLDEDERKLPKGDFGDYCPVTYVNDNWLIKGNSEHEVTIYGKTYWLAGEKEAEEFKFNPGKYLLTKDGRQQLPLQPPPPKIMVLGVKGSGVSTQIRMLCDKYKLSELNLQQEFLAKLKEEKDKRKRQRLLDRGFRPPQPAEEEGEDPLADPEIEEDPEDFDKEAHEKEVMKSILDSNKGLIIDGTWSDLPEDSNVQMTLQDLLFESRRVPEIVIIINCKEKSTFQRMIDEDSIKLEYDRLMEERDTNRKKQREEDRENKLKELQEDEDKQPEDIEEEMKQWDQDRDGQEEDEDENDPEKPNLDEMLEKQREGLRERREKDETFIEEFSNALKEKNVFVIDDIKTDISGDFVQIKILDRIKENFANRKDLIERQLAQELKPEEVPFYEKSYIYKPSKFGVNSPLCLSNPSKNKKYPVLYRERIYYLANQEERQEFLKEPSKYNLKGESVPQDLQIKPKLVVIGLPKCGKSDLCKTISNLTGAVHLKMSKIIVHFIENSRDSLQSDELRKLIKYEGKQINDDMLISLLLKRLLYKDCQVNGWVLEDFPKTKHQAVTMARRGLVPSNVFYMRSEMVNSFERTKDKVQQKFGAVRTILAQRIRFLQNNLPRVLSFYQQNYNNVCDIDTSKSKWFMKDRAMKEIQLNLDARQQFARDYFLMNNKVKERGCKLENLNMDKSLTKQSLSQFNYYCPVTWKNQKQLVKCNERVENAILFKDKFYYFQTTKERDMFYENPSRFLTSVNFLKKEDYPLRITQNHAAEAIQHEKAIQGHCPSTILDEERVIEGDPLLLVQYKERKFVFGSEFKLQRFLKSPLKYSTAELPVKMPPQEDKVSLFSLQQMEDSVSFMEQALGQVVTKGLREVSENRLKYPTLSIKESMLKLFALYLKTENPANTQYMKNKYAQKMKTFIERCELPEEIYDLAKDKGKLFIHVINMKIEAKKLKDEWPDFKEQYYNEIGAKYDYLIEVINQEKQDGFTNFMK